MSPEVLDPSCCGEAEEGSIVKCHVPSRLSVSRAETDDTIIAAKNKPAGVAMSAGRINDKITAVD